MQSVELDNLEFDHGFIEDSELKFGPNLFAKAVAQQILIEKLG